MRRVGRVRGKRSNKSRVTGRKRRDRWKQFAAAETINPACAEFDLQPSLKMSHRGLGNQALGERWSAGVDRADADDAVQLVKKATVSNVIEEAMARVDDVNGDEEDMGETTTAMAMACPVFELASGAILTSDGADVIPAIEEAFHREFGIYENAVEGSNFSETHFARRWGSVLSQESWSDVEFLESELESSEDDDWCMVVDGEDDV